MGFIIKDGVLKRYTQEQGVTEAVIPDNVVSIAPNAFMKCENLTTIKIPEGVTFIGAKAFWLCKSLVSIDIPHGVKSVEHMAFQSCTNLVSVTLPDTLTNIGNRAFKFCVNLKKITIPEGVKSIGENAFGNCSSLRSVIIPGSVSSIEEYAFGTCEKLRSVIIQNGVREIRTGAFYSCDKLKQVSLPESLIKIGPEAFDYCQKNIEFIFEQGINPCLMNVLYTNKICGFYDDINDHIYLDHVAPISLYKNDSYKNLKAAEFRKYIINKWKDLPFEVQCDIFMNKQHNVQTADYLKAFDKKSAKLMSAYIIDKLAENASLENCTAAVTFIILFGNTIDNDRVVNIYNMVSSAKRTSKLLKKLEKYPDVLTMLDQSNHNEIVSPVERIVFESSSVKQIEGKLKELYNFSRKDLVELKDSSGNMLSPYVLGYLLTAHESLKKVYGHDTISPANIPGLDTLTSKVNELLDNNSLQEALVQLIDDQISVLKRGTDSKKRFLVYPICRYADENTVQLLVKTCKYIYELNEAILYSDTKAALVYSEKKKILDKYAKIRNTDKESLYLKYMTDPGLDEHGCKVCDLGDKKVTMRLQSDLSFVFEKPDGKTAKSVPKKGSDPEKYKAVSDEVKELSALLKSRFNLVFEDFLSGRAQGADKWLKTYKDNSLMRAASGYIVWDQNGKTFIYTPQGYIDSNNTPYTITKKPIKVAHPMEMDISDLSRWQKYFTDNKIVQPFAQVWEPIRRPEDIHANRYEGAVIPVKILLSMAKHGIDAQMYNDMGSINADLSLKDCLIDYEEERDDLTDEISFKLHEFSVEKFTRKANHVIVTLDRFTLKQRIQNDDITTVEMFDSFTLAQIMDFIALAQKHEAVKVLAALMEYKNKTYPDYDVMDEFVLDW